MIRSEGKGNEAVHCSVPPGVGNNHALRVSFGDWTFVSSSTVGVIGGDPLDQGQFARISFESPTLQQASVPASSGLNTVGGGEFTIAGANFGPSSEAASISNITVAY